MGEGESGVEADGMLTLDSSWFGCQACKATHVNGEIYNKLIVCCCHCSLLGYKAARELAN